MSKIAILTAIYDDYDTLKPTLDQTVDVEWICVTDTLINKEGKGWKIVYEPRWHLHPNRAAKTPKMLPWLYTNADTSIWIDASFQITSSSFAEEVLHYADPIAQFNHPWRQCAYAEGQECILIPKYAQEVLQEQMDVMEEYGFPKDWGLWATGVIARKHTPEVISMGFDWMKQVHTYSYQDQVSYPFVCRMNNLRPINLPGTHLANQWLAYQGSGRHSHG
jgi:hypothetical protein